MRLLGFLQGTKANAQLAGAAPIAAPPAATPASQQSDSAAAQIPTGGDMSDDLITAENVSRELIRSIFDSAFMDPQTDSEGDIFVKEGWRVYVIPSKEKKRIRLLAQFGFKSSSTLAQQLEAVNKINCEYLIIRASAWKSALRFDHDIPLDGGLSKKALVLIVKRFGSIPHAAVQEHAGDIVD